MEIKIKNRHILKKKDINNIIEYISDQFDFEFDFNNSIFESGVLDDEKIIFIDRVPCFLMKNSKPFFTLFGINKFKVKNKFVVVDMGAVKFVTNGADVMTPGIVDADSDILKSDQVWICDEKNKKALAVGTALLEGEDMKKVNKGKAIKTLFFVGDDFWNTFAKSL